MIPVADTRALMGITFWAGTQRYALPIDRVREIQQIVAFAEVPDETGLVLGMVDVRGEIVPVVDIRTLIGLPREPYTLDTPMIVMLGADGPVALIVDAVDTVVDLPAEDSGPAPAMHSLASRILGVHHLDDGLVFVLDADALLEPVELPGSGETADE
jgi:purine-binding chemotaxis protein CheW